jgi:hypothetical protein
VVKNSANYTKNEGSNSKMVAPWQSKAVVHWTHKPKFEGLNPTTYTGIEKMAKRKNLMAQWQNIWRKNQRLRVQILPLVTVERYDNNVFVLVAQW